MFFKTPVHPFNFFEGINKQVHAAQVIVNDVPTTLEPLLIFVVEILPLHVLVACRLVLLSLLHVFQELFELLPQGFQLLRVEITIARKSAKFAAVYLVRIIFEILKTVAFVVQLLLLDLLVRELTLRRLQLRIFSAMMLTSPGGFLLFASSTIATTSICRTPLSTTLQLFTSILVYRRFAKTTKTIVLAARI